MDAAHTTWKTFTCHNTGADENLDPFTPAAGIHGAKFQWGVGETGTGYGISQADDQTSTSLPAGVTWKCRSSLSSLPSGIKTNPCPDGFRLPTYTEWKNVYQNNTITYVGTWDGDYTNYSSGAQIGTGLFLPAAGLRSNCGGSSGFLTNRAYKGYYWSSTPIGNDYYSYLEVESSRVSTSDYSGTLGMSVRCIEQ
jgi:uncharacterized protein (TIGR02145 family)